MTITPEVFFDIFILCLSWQKTCYTTVDHVGLILFRLGIITKKQRTNLSKDWRTQSIFIRNISRPPNYRKNQIRFDADTILDTKTKLVLNLDPVLDINRMRLMRDYKLYLTAVGEKYANSIKSKYSSLITKERYLEVLEVIKSNHCETAIGMIINRYGQKVEDETGGNPYRKA
ncbi:MAG: hypothetical protein V1649_00235 [Patescibacteria group bacterium]